MHIHFDLFTIHSTIHKTYQVCWSMIFHSSVSLIKVWDSFAGNISNYRYRVTIQEKHKAYGSKEIEIVDHKYFKVA